MEHASAIDVGGGGFLLDYLNGVSELVTVLLTIFDLHLFAHSGPPERYELCLQSDTDIYDLSSLPFLHGPYRKALWRRGYNFTG